MTTHERLSAEKIHTQASSSYRNALEAKQAAIDAWKVLAANIASGELSSGELAKDFLMINYIEIPTHLLEFYRRVESELAAHTGQMILNVTENLQANGTTFVYAELGKLVGRGTRLAKGFTEEENRAYASFRPHSEGSVRFSSSGIPAEYTIGDDMLQAFNEFDYIQTDTDSFGKSEGPVSKYYVGNNAVIRAFSNMRNPKFNLDSMVASLNSHYTG